MSKINSGRLASVALAAVFAGVTFVLFGAPLIVRMDLMYLSPGDSAFIQGRGGAIGNVVVEEVQGDTVKVQHADGTTATYPAAQVVER